VPRKVLALLLVALAALIGWRVLRPSEVVDAATSPYPVAQVLAPGVTGKTTMAPLIVDGRLRVYAGERLVKADAPVEAKTMYTPRWSYRRWPAKLSGIVASGPAVVSRWTDGLLVALDGRTGKVLWKANGPAAGSFAGRTGSDAVYAPPGLSVSGTSVLITASGRLSALSATDGTQLWTMALPADCGSVNDAGQFVCGRTAFDVATGRQVAPIAPRLRLTASSGAVTASGSASWRWAGEATVLGVRGQKVVLLAANRKLVELNAQTGAELTTFPLYTKNERVEPWKPYRWQLTDNWLALERLQPKAGTDPTEQNHYYTTDPVIIAAL
jgi:hypothetical protein